MYTRNAAPLFYDSRKRVNQKPGYDNRSYNYHENECNSHMKQCYLCGEELIKNRNKSKDHVPPDCIFPQDKPRNLITIPCCKNCNEEFAQLDEKMRNFLAILAIDKSGDVGQIAKRNVLKSQKRREEFLAYTKKIPLCWMTMGILVSNSFSIAMNSMLGLFGS